MSTINSTRILLVKGTSCLAKAGQKATDSPYSYAPLAGEYTSAAPYAEEEGL